MNNIDIIEHLYSISQVITAYPYKIYQKNAWIWRMMLFFQFFYYLNIPSSPMDVKCLSISCQSIAIKGILSTPFDLFPVISKHKELKDRWQGRYTLSANHHINVWGSNKPPCGRDRQGIFF